MTSDQGKRAVSHPQNRVLHEAGSYNTKCKIFVKKNSILRKEERIDRMEEEKVLKEEMEQVSGGKEVTPPCLYVAKCGTCGYEKVFETEKEAKAFIEENNHLCPECRNKPFKILKVRKY